MEDLLCCRVCGMEYARLIGTMEVKTNDQGIAESLIINNKISIDLNIPYPFRNQDNIHLLFVCENEHFFIKSFDSHKGNVYLDQNELMEDLENFLNARSEWFRIGSELVPNLFGVEGGRVPS